MGWPGCGRSGFWTALESLKMVSSTCRRENFRGAGFLRLAAESTSVAGSPGQSGKGGKMSSAHEVCAGTGGLKRERATQRKRRQVGSDR